MNYMLKFRDALEDPKVVIKVGSSRFGKYIENVYKPGELVDLGDNMKNESKKESKNANVIGFKKAISNYPGHIPDYYLEVPFAVRDPILFNDLYYSKFLGQEKNMRRGFVRADIYIPEYGAIIELDSKKYHTSIERPLDDTKENILWHNYGIPTVLRLNFASRNDWEIKRATKLLYDYLDHAVPLVYPIIDVPGIVKSWDLHNRELLPFFPYIETVDGNYYAEHNQLYYFREVVLDISHLPQDLKGKIQEDEIKKPLIELYKRIKNIDLKITTP